MGGSSVAYFPASRAPLTGWGVPFAKAWKSPLKVDNRAISGASTKSFINGGVWAKILAALKPGDYVFIHFAHNDEDPSKSTYTTPTQFQTNLRKFVNESRSKKAIPVLLTGVTRRKFNSAGVIQDNHKIYGPLLKEVATEMKTAFIDLNALSMKLVQSYGVTGSKRLYMHLAPGEYPAYPDGKSDDTHFQVFGAEEISKLVLDEIDRQNLPLEKYLR